MKMNEQIKRIEKMEGILNDATNCVEELNKLLPSIKLLLGYYGSREWFEDVDADSSGLLPKYLKRGVLSEDGIYNFISDLEELKKDLTNIN